MASVDTQSLRPRKEGLAERAVYHINNILEVPAKQVAGTSGVDRVTHSPNVVDSADRIHTQSAQGPWPGDLRSANQEDRLRVEQAVSNALCIAFFQQQMTRRTRKWFYLLELLLLLREGLNWKERKRQFVDFCFKLFIIGSDLNDICHYLHYVKLL